MEKIARDRVIKWLNDKCLETFDNGLCDICKIGDYFDCNTRCFKDLTIDELTDLYAKVCANCAADDKPADVKTNDPVNHPSHYTKGGIECLKAIEASMTFEEYMGGLKMQVMKYVWRYNDKFNPLEDLEKARFYLNEMIRKLEENNNGN